MPLFWVISYGDMSDNAHESVRKKVQAIFVELAGERAHLLEGDIFPDDIRDTIVDALTIAGATEDQALQVDEIAFHLADWNSDAAFLVALHLFPERFTAEEIEAAVDMFLVHVPAHVIAAARLAGHPTEDIFLQESDDEASPVD